MATRTTSFHFDMTDMLLRGWTGEVLPEEVERIRAAAQWYVGDASHPQDARDRVFTVWIEGKYLPAYDERVAR